MIDIHTRIETNAEIFAGAGSSLWLPCSGKINRWKISTFTAAKTSNTIFKPNVGSIISDFAFVLKSKIPDGIISHKPLRDQGKRCRDKPETGRSLEIPNNRRSNIKAAPTRNTIPTICTISSAGYNHNDWRIPAAMEVFSIRSANSMKVDSTSSAIRISFLQHRSAQHASHFFLSYADRLRVLPQCLSLSFLQINHGKSSGL